MEEDLNQLIIQLKVALNKKYGKNFKKFYLINEAEKNPWTGLISSADPSGNRNAEYYTVNEKEVLIEELRS